ncbi:MAG: hypothetical protein AUF65_02430 [Chloroflexi bacterium 13_1_20CM_50_12]|nr:MAG: hypothetical protein AUF65_02430 [Chloroflexi bacterium 13_1_20CM_50_12]
MVDYAGAIWSPNNNYFANTGKKSFVILHGTAGGYSAQGIADYFRSTEGSNSPVSSHYVVGQDGQIVQCIAEKDGSYANGVVNNPNWSSNPNLYTISIEHVKSSNDNSEPLTPAQQAASFALIKDICQRNGIGMHDADDTTGITGHFAIDPVNRARCPGTYPWQELFDYLKGNTNMGVPQGWKDSNNVLTAPNGIQVTLGFRDHILSSNWDKDNWPLEPEKHLTGLEMSNPSLGDGQSQLFRWKRLEYTPKMGVFEGWLGQELAWYQKQVTDMEKQIAALQHPQPANLVQINTLGKQIADDAQLILKLSQAQ